MVVGVENSNTEHKKVQSQRAKSDLGKAFEGFMARHTRKKTVPRVKKPVAAVAKKPAAAKKPFNYSGSAGRKPRGR